MFDELNQIAKSENRSRARVMREMLERGIKERKTMGVNNLSIIGNLGRDPESVGSYDKTIVKFSVGVNEAIKGEKKTTWFNCVSFAAKAEYLLRSCKKGTQVYIEVLIDRKSMKGKTRWSLYVNKVIVLQ
jgi:single-stranded DNA-binding protein